MDSYLWCTETGWSLTEWLSLPEPIKHYWMAYREAKIGADKILARSSHPEG